MFTGEGTREKNLEVLPLSIRDAHNHILEVIDKLNVLEGFLFGSQVMEIKPTGKEPKGGLVDKCFTNLTDMSNSIEECNKKLVHIIDKLGVPEDRGVPEEREIT